MTTDSEFASLGLDVTIVETLLKLGYETPTPVQRAAIPLLIAGGDVLAEAATGTGKTAAFSLPLLQRLRPFLPRSKPRALILTPTRELAIQVKTALTQYSEGLRCSVCAVYGGASIGQQIGELKRGAHIIVATPGRAVDLLSRGILDLSEVSTVVLDEADEMLDMGFAEDLDTLLSAAPAERQTALFSATMPRHIAQLARQHQREPVHLKIERSKNEQNEPLVEQLAVICRDEHRLAAFERILMKEAPTSALAFCRTREDVDELCAALNEDGFAADALHGGHSQAQRDAVMRRFRNGQTQLLIATDVAARGLDVSGMSHVFNMDLPESAEVYTHRIGRVGRAGKTGRAISFCAPHRTSWLGRFERQTRGQIEPLKVPSTAELEQLQAGHVQAELQLRLDTPPEGTEELLAELLKSGSPEAVASAALGALLQERYGKQRALFKRVPDQAFVPPPRPNRAGGGGRPFHKGPVRPGPNGKPQHRGQGAGYGPSGRPFSKPSGAHGKPHKGSR